MGNAKLGKTGNKHALIIKNICKIVNSKDKELLKQGEIRLLFCVHETKNHKIKTSKFNICERMKTK